MLPEIVPPEFENTWIAGLSNEEYHGDRSAVSSSALKKILKSEAAFYSDWLGHTPRYESEAMRLGSMVHCAVLESNKFLQTYKKSPPFGDMRIKKNKEAKEEFLKSLEPGVELIDEAQYAQVEGVVNSILRHQDAAELLKHGEAEVSGFYRDPGTGIKCRIRPDYLNYKLMALVDLKTTTDCTSESFRKTIWNFRYDFQAAHYSAGIKLITGKDVDFTAFIAVEKEPPYDLAVYAFEGPSQRGIDDYHQALSILANCLRRKQWDPYQKRIQSISLPEWIR